MSLSFSSDITNTILQVSICITSVNKDPVVSFQYIAVSFTNRKYRYSEHRVILICP